MLHLLLPLIAQLGPSVGVGPGPAHRAADLPIPRHHTIVIPDQPAPATGTAADPGLAACLRQADADPKGALAAAEALGKAGKAMAAGWCRGSALAAQGQWSAAQAAWLAARNAAPVADKDDRARLTAIVGNAALAEGKPGPALALLDEAHGGALGAGDLPLAGAIAIDRARALVALGRTADAASALAEARAQAPDEPQGWLLSATLSRREGQLATAQAQIERAAALAPADAEVALEAGVIAVLLRHDDAARKSWNSVLALAPGTPLAATAQGYLDQLGPAAPPSPPR